MLRCAEPILRAYDAPGPVLRLAIPTSGQTTLARVRDERVGLALLLFYVLANPRLAVKDAKGTRAENEPWYWAGGARAEPRCEVLREVRRDDVVFYFCVRDPGMDLALGVARAVREHREVSGDEWRARMDVIASQGYYVEVTLGFAGLPAGEATLYDLQDPMNPAHVQRLLRVDERHFEFPGGAQVLPVCYQHPLHVRGVHGVVQVV